ncbi:MAG: metallophosphoesterase family protein [Halobacteriovoraceae bacterium]|nr:metallophosphoesterase family protein [Halobacteriovoraceae bacterium]
MKFSSISDIHIESHKDEAYQLLLKFLHSKEVDESDVVVFLGDVFDLMIGNFEEYVQEYGDFFEVLQKLIKKKKIVWVEGNHDFHIEDLFRKQFKEDFGNFSYIKEFISFEDKDEKIYISHGDGLDYKNINYMKYRKLIRSDFSRLLANYFFSYDVVLKLKDKFSEISKNAQKNFKEEVSRARFREYAASLKDLGFSKVFLGHSHVPENWDNFYFNNGYCRNSKSFIFYNKGVVQLIEL